MKGMPETLNTCPLISKYIYMFSTLYAIQLHPDFL